MLFADAGGPIMPEPTEILLPTPTTEVMVVPTATPSPTAKTGGLGWGGWLIILAVLVVLTYGVFKKFFAKKV